MGNDATLPNMRLNAAKPMQAEIDRSAMDMQVSSEDECAVSAQETQALKSGQPTHLTAPGRKPLFRT
jgi:hypothetical protein